VKKPIPLTYKTNNCYLSAFFNSRHHYKHLGLKLVIGSLGINGWFEFGGPTYKKADFAKNMNGISSDSHCWLEDADGNVYDFLFESYDLWVKFRTHRPMKRKGLLEGVSKAELARDGIQYIPADKESQTMLFINSFKYLKEAEERFCTGRAHWTKNGYMAWSGTREELDKTHEGIRHGQIYAM
jgi:hypothetical protein